MNSVKMRLRIYFLQGILFDLMYFSNKMHSNYIIDRWMFINKATIRSCKLYACEQKDRKHKTCSGSWNS